MTDINDVNLLSPQQRSKLVAELGLRELVARDAAKERLAAASVAAAEAAAAHAAEQTTYDTKLAVISEPLTAALKDKKAADAMLADAAGGLKKAQAAGSICSPSGSRGRAMVRIPSLALSCFIVQHRASRVNRSHEFPRLVFTDGPGKWSAHN